MSRNMNGACAALAVALIMLVSALTMSAETEGPPAKASVQGRPLPEWTFALYLDGDNDLEGSNIGIFIQEGWVGSTSDLQLITLFDRDPAYDARYGDWSDTRCFKVMLGDTPTPEKNLANWDPHERNMGDPATLVEFGKFVLDNYPAQHYALVLSDHGGGYSGVCYEYRLEGTTTYVEDYLTMNELASAMNDLKSYKGSKFDLLAFDACMMGAVDPFYAVRGCAEVVTASEYITYNLPYSGMQKTPPDPDQGVLPILAANPLMTPTELATVIVDQAILHYSEFAPAQNVAAFNLDAITGTEFVAKINDLSIQLMRSKSTCEVQVEDIRHNLLSMGSLSWTDRVDLVQLMRELADPANGVNAQDLKSAATALKDYIELPSVRLHIGYGASANLEHGGLAIFYPCDICNQLVDYFWQITPFGTGTYWDDFLLSYDGTYGDDTTPPADTYGAMGTLGSNGWWKSSVSATLSGWDGAAGSGVVCVAYRLDGGAWQVYNTPLTVTGEGQHVLEYFSVDRNANNDGTHVQPVKIDTTAPVTSAQVNGEQVTLNANDAASGVAATSYRIDSGSTVVYTGPFTVGSGQHTVYYSSTDVAGNVETEKSVSLGSEAGPPVTTVQFSGTVGYNGWFRSAVEVTMSAQDPDGIQATYYKVDNARKYTIYSGPFMFTSQGKHTIYYYSVDRTGSTETAKSIPIWVDATPPTTTATSNARKLTVTLSASDGASGVATTFYWVDNGPLYVYSSPIKLTKGTHTVYYFSTDVAGNQEAQRSIVVSF